MIDKIAALVPPARAYRHRCFGVLAPNASLRAAVTALAPVEVAAPPRCPICHSQIRIIAFINDAGSVKKILDPIGESTRATRISPALGPPLWEAAAAAEQTRNGPQWDSSAQPAMDIEFDQRIAG